MFKVLYLNHYQMGRNSMMKGSFLVICSLLICLTHFNSFAADSKINNQQQIANVSVSRQAAVKSSVNRLTTDVDILDSKLNAMFKMEPAERQKAWVDLRGQIERLKISTQNMQRANASLKGKKLNKSDWSTTGNQLNQTKQKMDAINLKYRTLSEKEREENLKEDIKKKRSETESKFKEGEQARNSDYNILISITKTMNEELGIFNKAWP